MKEFIKRTLSTIVAVAMLMLSAPKIFISSAEKTVTTIPKTIFALPSELDTTWNKEGLGTLESPAVGMGTDSSKYGTNQYVYWGQYPQNEITNITGLSENVDYVQLNSQYFKIEPIKWRVLSNSGDNLFLMSDKCLDAKAYNSIWDQPNRNWSNCDLRTWLTGTFFNTAFTGTQQDKIANTEVNAPYATTSDMNNYTWATSFASVTDKLFLLSGDLTNKSNIADVGTQSELRNKTYGFAANNNDSPTRRFALTDFAVANNAVSYDGFCFPWARSAFFGQESEGNYSAFAFLAFYLGNVHYNYAGSNDCTVAPALKIPLTSVLFSSAAESTISSSGEFTEISANPAMALRFSGGQSLADTTVTKSGNTVNYAGAPEGSTLVVVATYAAGKSYQYHEILTSENGSVDLSSKGIAEKGIAEGSTYEAWVETEDNGILNASSPISGNIESAIKKHAITYKNYDGSEIENLPDNYPTTYTEGQTLTLPTGSPDSTISGWEFLGFWDQALDQSKKVTIPGPGYEDEQTLDLTIGNKITEISAQATDDITLYARYTSNVFDEDVNGRENYIFGAPGVFPNGSTASMRVLEPGTEEYRNTLQNVDNKDVGDIKIVEFQVLNSQGEVTQPNTFFGDAVIGFKIPEGFKVDDTSLIRVVANGEDITLRSRIWTDPDNPDLKYIEGVTNHFSPYAILSPWNEGIVATGDNTWIWITGISAVLVVSAGIFVWLSRKKKFKKV